MSRKEYAGGPVPRYLLLGAAVFLTAFGLTMVYSASSISALVKEGSLNHYFVRQIIFVLMGAVLAFVAARIDYRRFQGRLAMNTWWAAVGTARSHLRARCRSRWRSQVDIRSGS